MIHKALAQAATLGFLIALSASCDPSQGRAMCQPSNCDGCCDEAGVCQRGGEQNACGELGGACQVCPANHSCSAGMCLPSAIPRAEQGTDAGIVDSGIPCDPTTCTGCCLNGVCTPGNADSACGTGGGECAPCFATQICSGGLCTEPCMGCRDASGICRPGGQANACGVAGSICAACLADQICELGVCKNTACSATNCAGCCAGNVCVNPVNNAQCGANGSPCTSCGPSDTCQAGTCG